MRVLQLISSAGYYGAENVVVNLAAALRDQGCQPVVGAFHAPGAPEPDILRFARERGVESWSFPCAGKLDRGSVNILRRELGRFDILHTHGYKANLYGWLASRGLGVGPIATCHNWPNRKGSLALYAALDRIILRRFPKVFAVSEGVMELLAQFGIRPPQAAVINNGIDTQRFRDGLPDLRAEWNLAGKTVVGTVTRLVPGKGVEVLIASFAALAGEFPGAALVIVGAGPLEEPLRAQAAATGLGDRILFTGARGDMPAVYATLDVFTLASFDEGMPMTVLESMSSGCAVAATSVGAIPRLVRDGSNGLLIPPREQESLTRGLRSLLGDAPLRARLGAEARSTIEREFSAAAMARQYVVHFQSVSQRRKEAA
jgi:glycosyltransferase involved in cell wall biosynthesis